MIINLLMGADARGTRGRQGRNERWFCCIVYLGWISRSILGFFFRAVAHVLVGPFKFPSDSINFIS